MVRKGFGAGQLAGPALASSSLAAELSLPRELGLGLAPPPRALWLLNMMSHMRWP